MRFSIAFLALCVAHGAYSQGIYSILDAPKHIVEGAGHVLGDLFGSKTADSDTCSRDVTPDYKKAMEDFQNKLYARVADRTDNHFVFSPYSIWLSLSALAEGADRSIQRDFFSILNLPQETCLRRRYYNIALNAEQSRRDVVLKRRRSLILDYSLKVNPSWSNLMKRTRLLRVAYGPIRKDPQSASDYLTKLVGAHVNMKLKANSILWDKLDYQGLWTTAFAEADIVRQPFHDDLGQEIGTVDMMHMKKQVRLAQVPFMDAKVLELPVGTNGRYTMLIAVSTGDNIIKNAISVFMGSILKIFSLLQLSVVPLHIAVPRFELTSVFNLKHELEEIGMVPFWKDPAATRYVSTPAAMPSGLIQRVSVKVDSEGLQPPPVEAEEGGSDLLSGIVNFASNAATGVADAVGHDFVADRPFMFALFDTKSHTCVFAGAYSRPDTD